MTAVCSELTNEELAVLAKDDEAALERLIIKNDRFVYFLANSFLNGSGVKEFYPSDYIEDLAQTCRLTIPKAVNNFHPDYGTKFLTFSAKIMRRAMWKRLKKDEKFRNNEGELFPEEGDHSLEEYGEGYIDPLDKDIEDLPSEDGSFLSDQDDLDENIRPARKKQYYHCFPRYTPEEEQREIEEVEKEIEEEASDEDSETKSSDSKKKKVEKGPFDENNYKNTEYSWEYPVFHKTLHDMQMKTVLQELYGSHFDEAHREYLIYRFGLKDLIPKTQTETAEHFNLRITYAKKIEKEALGALRKILQKERLL